ncbi:MULTISPECIES: hypothetical protein [Priestia]|uniref:Uncharacterized protein n=1 Tax=Priestia aryabhattai TaxID=412384 RepID=A0A7W3NG51_PRIAR|nr:MULTISPECIES: hypothetical protein [Priestia]MBA9042405.1 hypothetical protein [Priestia aryabhattai]USL27516.1 hypothetical protein LIT33_27545 [Priestia megaterium]USL33445.1 hypothetical protein LIT30_27945 [Priestia megaterium]USL39378.1 hypothetical protein LIT34_29570 [Priestia megaterium]WDM31537.1 hypothetical protein J8N01_00615 [Priestia megaterium]
MISVKKVACIYYGIRMDVFKPEEIISSNHMQSRGYFTCPYCGDIEITHECQEGKSRFMVAANGDHAHDCLYNE